jgi:response regulator NasT
MSTLLLASDDPSVAAPLRAIIESLPHEVLGEVTEPSQLNTEVVRLAPQVIIACAATPSRDLLDNLRALSTSCPRPVVMFASDPRRDVIRSAVEAGVSAYVVDGWAPERVTPIIEAACARFEAHEAVKKELCATQHKLAERKVIEKAKGIVMQQRGLSEEHAYSALRKMAMDQNLALAEVARRVIAVAHLLA